MTGAWRRSQAARAVAGASATLAALGLAAPAAAHGGGLGAAARSSLTIPTWLVLLTGGAAVGASFLLASFVTDRRLIAAVDGWGVDLPEPGRVGPLLLRGAGLLALAAVLAVAFLGPQSSANLAVLVVWVGWWSGYTMTTYLVGDTWPAVNPWRTLARWLPSLEYPYPERLGAWPAVVALLLLVWVEIVNPLAEAPRLLGAVVLSYTVFTLGGAVLFGPATWFREGDPVAQVFAAYGRVAPVARTPEGALRLRLPGSGLAGSTLAGRSDVAFVVGLLWATTFDGLVATPAWRGFARTAVGAGVPSWLVYPVALVAGFVAFLAIFRLASRGARHTGRTYRSADAIARAVAPSLLAIAAGYHLAHYLGYFLTFLPGLVAVAPAPFDPVSAIPTLALPAWFEGVGIGTILVGHLLAIWVAHSRTYDLFPGKLQAIRSQYPLVAVMVFYTVVSLWILAQPEVAVIYT
jgi:hypothetical protein